MYLRDLPIRITLFLIIVHTETITQTMTIKTPTKQDTFTISYQRQEAEKVIGMEYELMKHFGFNRSQLHKNLVRDAYRQLRMLWALSSLSTAVFTNRRGRMTKQVKISDVHYQMLMDVGKKWRMKPDALVEELIQETYSNKTKRK